MNEKSYIVIGVMSGTSLDGVDLAHIHFKIKNQKWVFEILECETISYSQEWLNQLKIAVGFSKEKLENSLTWFLEIDTANYSKCDINGQPIILGEDKKIISGSPDGLERTYNNYWFKIKK